MRHGKNSFNQSRDNHFENRPRLNRYEEAPRPASELSLRLAEFFKLDGVRTKLAHRLGTNVRRYGITGFSGVATLESIDAQIRELNGVIDEMNEELKHA